MPAWQKVRPGPLFTWLPTSLSTPRSDRVRKTHVQDVYASDLLYIVGMWLTKCSAAFLFLRLSPDRVHMAAAKALLAASTVFMLISVLAVALRCSLAHPWLVVGEQCSGLVSGLRVPRYLQRDRVSIV